MIKPLVHLCLRTGVKCIGPAYDARCEMVLKSECVDKNCIYYGGHPLFGKDTLREI